MLSTTQSSLSFLSRNVILLSAYLASSFSFAAEMPLETITAKSTSQTQYLQLDAKVEPIKSATVAAQTSGRVLAIHYDVNDMVPEGAPLIEITSKEQGAGLAAAEAELAKAQAQNFEAQAQFERYKALFPQGAISKGAMDEATSYAKSSKQAVSAAKAKLISAKENVNYTIVSAPFSGRVTAKWVEQGETISYGQALLSGYATDKLRAVFYVPQQYRKQLTALDSINLSDDYQQYQSDKINKFNFSTQADQSIEVRVQLNNHQDTLQAGQWLKAALPIATTEAIYLPKSAIFQVGELTAVYRKQGDKYLQTQVRLGKQLTGNQLTTDQVTQVEVLSGVMDGDNIINDAASYVLFLNQAHAN